MSKTNVRFKKMDCVLHQHYGPLYVVRSFRDDSGTVWEGINGKDGINYNFNACEVSRKLTRDEFDSLLTK